MLKDRYEYIAVFTYADDGISIEFPDLPGCLPFAEDGQTETAFKNAKEAMGLHLFGIEQDNDPIPTPTSISDISLEDGQIPALIDVYMPAIRDRAQTRFVKKTLSIPAWLNDMAKEDGINFSKVLQDALMEKVGVYHATK